MEESLWISGTKKTNYQTLEKDEKTDVCVIGGGIVGAITANSTVKLTSQHGLFYKYLYDEYGANFAKLYLESNENGIKLAEKIIKMKILIVILKKRIPKNVLNEKMLLMSSFLL